MLRAYQGNPEKFKKLVANGPPAEYRWEAWKTLMGVEQVCDSNAYQALLNEASKLDEETHPVMRQIEADVTRTFSWHPYFDNRINEVGIKRLRRCLRAFAMYNKEIGYTQSMNYVMGFILLVSGGNEEEAFWVFVELTKGNEHFAPGIEQFYTDGFPLYHQFVDHFDSIFEEKLPTLRSHFEEIDFCGPVWLQKWFITLFLYSFPLALCARIWDNILVEGPVFMFKTIISVISGLQKKLIKGDFDTVNKLLSEMNTGDRKVTIKHKNDILPGIEEVVSKAQKIQITLPDPTASSISPQ